MKPAIIILGSPNDADGNLSSIALERCHHGLQVYQDHPGSKIIPTGGWGGHFNTTSKPHGFYIGRYLTEHGVPAAAIVEIAESTNTVEDSTFCRPIVDRHGFTRLVVVTSDFHVLRARFVFERTFPDIPLTFSPAETHLPPEDLHKLQQHERRALAKLRGDTATD